MDLDAIRNDARFWFWLLAPTDLAPGVPLYLLRTSDLPAGYSCPNSLAFTHPTLDCQARQHIGAQWRGRGPCFVLVTENLARFSSQYLRATLTHEFAHWITWRLRPLASDPSASLPDDQQWLCSPDLIPAIKEAQRLHNIPSPPEQQLPWWSHDLPFIRASAILWHRGRQRALWVRPDELHFAGSHYGLSPAADYVAALAGELECEGSIAEQLERPAPAAAVELFERDCENYFERQRAAESAAIAGETAPRGAIGASAH